MTQRLLLSLCALTVTFGLVLRQASAHVAGELHHAGSPFLIFPDSSQDQGRVLALNGVSARLTTGLSKEGVDALLDHFEQQCVRDSTFAKTSKNTEQFNLRPVFRWNDGQQGVAVCLYNPKGDISLRKWMQRLEGFGQSKDLSEMGDIRYLRLDRVGSQTRLVALETHGSVPLEQPLALHGDAPGTDLPYPPRPESSTRILSAHEVGTQPRLTGYRLDHPEDADLYLDRLRDQGYRVQPTGGGNESRTQYRITNPGHPATILTQLRSGDKTLIVFGR